jgi:hypothetical protein
MPHCELSRPTLGPELIHTLLPCPVGCYSDIRLHWRFGTVYMRERERNEMVFLVCIDRIHWRFGTVYMRERERDEMVFLVCIEFSNHFPVF